jgi:hypothetical protein
VSSSLLVSITSSATSPVTTQSAYTRIPLKNKTEKYTSPKPNKGIKKRQNNEGFVYIVS